MGKIGAVAATEVAVAAALASATTVAIMTRRQLKSSENDEGRCSGVKRLFR
jgi:uncharacterized membrane protein